MTIIKQIVEGIHEFQKFKIFHRDLKMENILVHQGIPKIADFGFAKELAFMT